LLGLAEGAFGLMADFLPVVGGLGVLGLGTGESFLGLLSDLFLLVGLYFWLDCLNGEISFLLRSCLFLLEVSRKVLMELESSMYGRVYFFSFSNFWSGDFF
jgi:hypothetical protein